jgi:hypothetical protein
VEFSERAQKQMTFFLTSISFVAVLISLTYISDRILPGKTINTKVIRVGRGLEHVSRHRKNVLTHFLVVGEDHRAFPIYLVDFDAFHRGDEVGFGYSTFFDKHSKIENYTTGETFYPSQGIYSHFFLVVLFLFLSGVLGIYFRKKSNLHGGLAMASCGLIIFLIFV